MSKKKARKRTFPTSRLLTLDRLFRERVCISSILAFIQVFKTVEGVIITEKLIRGLPEKDILMLGQPAPSRLLSLKGRYKLWRFMRMSLLTRYDNSVPGMRKYLIALARHFIRYPKRLRFLWKLSGPPRRLRQGSPDRVQGQ